MWREKRGLKLKEAEEVLGISYASISRIERGLQLCPRTVELLIQCLEDTRRRRTQT